MPFFFGGLNRPHTEQSIRLQCFYRLVIPTTGPSSGGNLGDGTIFVVNASLSDGGIGAEHKISPWLVTRSNLAHSFVAVTVRYGKRRARERSYVQLWRG